MAEQKLVDYIKIAKEAGQTDEQTRGFLFKNGWTEAEVNDAFSAASSSGQQTQAQPQAKSPQPQFNPQPQQQTQPQPQTQAQPQAQPKPQFQPQQQAAARQPEFKTRKKSPVLALLMVLLVVILLGAAGTFTFFYFQNNISNLNVVQPQPQTETPSTSQVPAQNTTETPAATETAWCYTFSGKLGFANSGTDVIVQLHKALQKEGISFAPDAENVYATGTAAAITQFQQKYGISPASGFAGLKTIEKINSLYGCPATPSTNP